MEERKDKLGRRIPVFDRSAASKKAAATRKRNEGQDVHSKQAKRAGKKSTRGYFGYLKDKNPEALKELSRAAAAKRRELDIKNS